MGEAAESIWRRVNIAIVESSFRFITIVHGSFMFSFKKALLPWNLKCRGDKMSVAYWRPVLKFWSPSLNLWSHWRPVSRNFGPWIYNIHVYCTLVCLIHKGAQILYTCNLIPTIWSYCHYAFAFLLIKCT